MSLASDVHKTPPTLKPTSPTQLFGFPPAFADEPLITESGKEKFKPLLSRVLTDEGFHEHLAKEGFLKPELVVQISEVWVSNLAGRDSRGSVWPSQDPDRTEAIIVVIPALECSLIGMCPIFNAPTRHAEYRELDPWTRHVGGLSLRTEETLQ
jgi:hypothetical protein